MRITPQQQEILNSLSCERLSSNINNLRLVEDFYNTTNDFIAQTLRNEAFEEDEKGSTAYYVVKDRDGQIIFFFSLKCGLLYDEFIEGEQLKMFTEFYNLIMDKQKDPSLSQDDRSQCDFILEMIRSKKGLKRELVAEVLHKNKNDIDIDVLFQHNQHNVGKTYSGVELMHFCKNDRYYDRRLANEIKPLGAIVFWQFVVPTVIDLMKIVGCEYLFLFAADLTDDLLLVNYYREYLGFTDKSEHQVAMPLYDLTCQFMYQKTSELANKRKEFFEHFNPDDDAI